MIENPQIFKILDKEIISFNDENYLVLIENDVFYRVNYKAKLLGVLKDNLILLVKGKFIISIDFSSFSLNRVLYKGTIDSYAASDSSVWFLQNNIVYQIDLERQVIQYDDFSHTQVLKIRYLQGLETLVFVVKNESGMKVHFENSSLPSLNFSDISAIPDISFESKYGVILSIGRSVFEYNIQNKQLQFLEQTNTITLKWNTNSIRLDYKITSTDITIIDQKSKTYTIDSDVWKIINTGQAIYLFSDSINAPLCVNKIDRCGKFFEVYNLKTCNYLIELKKHEHVKSSPYLKFFSSTCASYSSAIFFIHGGPHQKAGNLWDPLIATLLQKKYIVYVPQYPGTFGAEKIHSANYGIDDVKDLIIQYDEIRRSHQRVILIGHSYGAFLGLKVFLQKGADILIGINGVYDLATISSLNPKTYARLNKQEIIARSPKCNPNNPAKCGVWHHVQFEGDPLIKRQDLENSINKVGGKGPTIHYLNFSGHGTFNRTQSSQIVELIKMIEQQFYNPSKQKAL